jgi:hypothetical protein
VKDEGRREWRIKKGRKKEKKRKRWGKEAAYGSRYAVYGLW